MPSLPNNLGLKPFVKNPAGYSVPQDYAEHLHWWYQQLPELRTLHRNPDLVAECLNGEFKNLPIQKELNGAFLLNVLDAKIKALDFRVSPWLRVYIMYISHNRDEINIWAMLLKQMSFNLGGAVLNITVFSMVFKQGVPTEESMIKLWNMQKVTSRNGNGENLLDLVYPQKP